MTCPSPPHPVFLKLLSSRYLLHVAFPCPIIFGSAFAILLGCCLLLDPWHLHLQWVTIFTRAWSPLHLCKASNSILIRRRLRWAFNLQIQGRHPRSILRWHCVEEHCVRRHAAMPYWCFVEHTHIWANLRNVKCEKYTKGIYVLYGLGDLLII